MAAGEARMSLMDHLGELRMRIIRIVVILAIAVLVFYMCAPMIGTFLIMPIQDMLPSFNDSPGLYAFTPFESFTTRFKIAFWTAIVACTPMIIWQILAFLLPALRPNERKWFLPTVFAAIALFIFGAVFCYLVILRTAFQWLIDQSAGLGDIWPQMSSYIEIIIRFEIGFGIAFQLPLIVFYLIVFRVVPYKTLRKSWRVIYIVLLIFSAVITPDGSPVSMMLLFVALAGLYEISLFLSRCVLAKRIAKEKAEERELLGKYADDEDEDKDIDTENKQRAD